MRSFVLTLACIAVMSATYTGALAEQPANKPPKGFTALFNGENLDGWRGLGHTDPRDIEKMNDEARAKMQAKDNEDMRAHWRAEGGEIINDGHGVFLTTDKDYEDFELYVDWRMMTPGTDSGIYLRGSPQVQIWDPDHEKSWKNGSQKGSGALWNNMNEDEGKWPLKKMDRPVGEWNTFHIKMVGPRVTVYFNGELTVDNAVMENYFDRSRPIFRTGPIQLQTHGGEMRFRNVFVREIGPDERCEYYRKLNADGFKSLFNHKNLDGWTGATDAYEVEDGALRFAKGGGALLTEEVYDDFAFRFEFKMPEGGNNGIAVRAPSDSNDVRDTMEVQILDDFAKKHAKIKPWQHHGSLYAILAATPGYSPRAHEWNFEEIIAKGSHIIVKVNGYTIVDADLDKLEETASGKDVPGMKRREGRLGFLSHGSPVAFRNVSVKRLK